MKGCNTWYCIIYLLTLVQVLSAQTRKELENQRMQVIEQIELTDELIAKSEQNRQKGINELATLQAQIQQRNTLLNNIKATISNSEIEIERNQERLDSLQLRLDLIQKQYGLILRSKYKQKLKGPSWINILSAANLNEAFLRWNYYRQFDRYREAKLKEIKRLETDIQLRNDTIKQVALDNAQLIAEQQIQNTSLQARIDQQNDLIQQLQKDKTILNGQLASIQASREILNQAIEDQLLGKNTTQVNVQSPDISPESISFPVTNGYIVPEVELGNNVASHNSCVIQLAKEAKVIAIAAGRVAGVHNMDGIGKMIILQHGKHYSIYANMHNVRVKSGQEVVANQILGTATEDKLHFEIWNNKERLDPKAWIE